MSKNTLLDLNNHLFAQLERLGEEDLKEDDLKNEIEKAKAISNLAKFVVSNAKLSLEATKFRHDSLPQNEANDLIPQQFRLKE